jgi:cytochrome P450
MLDRMREEAPIQFDARLHGWLIGRHRDITALQRDPRLSSHRLGYMDAALPADLKARIAPLIAFASTWLTMLDGAAHARVRKLAAGAFQPRFLKRMEARIEALADTLIDRGLAEGRMDVMADLAYPLTQLVIGEMVGLPAGDRARLLRWVGATNGLLAANLTTAALIDDAQASFTEMRAYYAERVAARRRDPAPDELISSLATAAEGGDRLTDDEIVGLIAFLVAGAYDTTAHLIGNALHLILTHPEARAALREDPALIPAAVEEVLRLEPSILINTRLVTAPIEHEGFRFEPGQIVYFLAGAANRDPEAFPDPARFDVRRRENRHVSFGFGAHFCLGAPLARLEAQIAIRRFLARAPAAALLPQAFTRGPGFITRPLQQLLVEVR